MQRTLTVIFFGIINTIIFAQELKPFALSGQTEPDQRKLVLKDNNDGFYAVVKVKGNESSKSIYQLVHYNASNDLVSQQNISLNVEDNVSYLKLDSNYVFLFLTRHNFESHTSTLFKKTFSLDLKNEQTDTLIHTKIGHYVNSTAKGAIDQIFDFAIRSKQGRNFITPLEYRFYFEESDNGAHLLIYHYDHSESVLKTKLHMYNSDLSTHKEGLVGVDRGYVNHGFKVNSNGALFIVKSNYSGKVAIIKYNMDERSHKYVYLPATNSQRTDVKTNFVKDNLLLVTTLNKKNGVLLGYTLAYFDFVNEKITHQYFYSLEEQFKKQITDTEEGKNLDPNSDFKNYELLEVNIDSLGNIYTLIELRKLEINAYEYNAEAKDILKEQIPKMGQVVTSTIILSKFDDYFLPTWTTFHVKYQSSDLAHGLNNGSLISRLESNGNRKIFYASSRKGIFLNDLHLVSVSKEGIVDVLSLDNQESLTPVLPYCYLNESTLIFVGKKGLLGKKTFITNYLTNDQ